jgi:hypothetical protein
VQAEQHAGMPHSGAPSSAWEGRLEIIIALEAISAHEVEDAEDHQEKAADYTLAEVILATSLFLFGVAGISSRWRIKIGALAVASGVFLVALVVLATV